jgi:hypothetical protein
MHGLYNYSRKIKALVFEIRYFALTCLVEKNKMLFPLVLLLGIGFSTRILHMPKMRGSTLANIKKYP